MKIVRWLLAVIILVVVTAQTVPFVVRDLIVYSLLEQGAETVKLASVKINWLNTSIELNRLDIRHADASVLNVRQLKLDIYLQEILDKRIRLSGLRLEGVDAKLHQEQQRLLLGPIVLFGGAAQDNPQGDESSFEFGSDLIELVDINLQLAQEESAQRLNIERLTVGGLYQWAPFEATNVRFVGRLNDAPVVIDSSALPLPERKTLSIQLALRDLNMSPLVGHLVPGLEASLAMNLEIDIEIEGYQARLSQTGSIGISGLNLPVNDLELGLGGVSWQGETEQEVDLSKGAELFKNIRLNGTLDLMDLDVRQQASSLVVKALKLSPSLTYLADLQQVQGSLALGTEQLALVNNNQLLSVAQLSASLTEQPLGLNLEFSSTGVQLSEGQTVDLGIARVDVKSNLGIEQGRPQWQPTDISGELRLVDVHARQTSNQLGLDAVKIDFSSTRLSELDGIEVDGVLYGMSADTSAFKSNAERMSLSTRLQHPEGGLSVNLGLSKINLTDGQFVLDSSDFDFGFDGQLGFSAQQRVEFVSGEVDVRLGRLAVTQDESRLGLELLQLTGPLRVKRPTDGPYGLQLVESLALDSLVESLTLEGSNLAGGFDRLLLTSSYTKAKGELDLGLDLAGLDVAASQAQVRSSQLNLGFDGQLIFTAQQSIDSIGGELDIQGTGLGVKQGDNNVALEQLTLTGPFRAKLPANGVYDYQLVETLEFDTLLESLAMDGKDLAGGFDRLSLTSGYTKAKGELDLGLNLAGLDVTMNHTQVKSEQFAVAVDGLVTPSLDELNADLQLNLNQLSVRQAQAQLALNELSFNGSSFIHLSAESAQRPSSIIGDIRLSTLAFNSPDVKAKFRTLASSVDLSQDLNSAVITGDLNLDDLDVDITGQQLRIGKLYLAPNLTTPAGLSSFNPSQLAGSVDLELSTLNLNSQATSLSLQGLELNNRLTPKASGQNLVSRLIMRDIGLSDAQQEVGVSMLSANIVTELDSQLRASQLDLTHSTVTQLQYTPKPKGESVSVAGINLERLSAVSQDSTAVFDTYDAKGFAVDKLLVGPADTPTASLDSLLLDGVSFSDNYLKIGQLITSNLKANIQTRLNATPDIKDKTNTATGAAGSASPEVVSSEEPNAMAQNTNSNVDKRLPIDISFDSWLAQGRTELNYRDASLAAPLNLNFVATEIRAAAWDSRTASPLSIKLKGHLNESTDIDIDARITPLKTKPDGDWTISVNALPLPSLSPMAQSFAGYQLRSGMLNLSAKGTLVAGQIKGSNKISVQRLEVQRGETVEAGATDQLFTMPLPSVVSLLEDDERMIKLDLPVSGDINDPKFNYQDVIQLVVTTAVKEGAITYLTRSLQPYGAILMAYGAIKEAQSGRFIQLQPLEFDPASALLNQVGRDYAAKLAGMMEERPGLTIEICPITLASEEPLLQQSLMQEQSVKGKITEPNAEPQADKSSDARRIADNASAVQGLDDELKQRIATLANQRIDALSSALVRVGINKERIFPCIARSGATDGVPRVELAF